MNLNDDRFGDRYRTPNSYDTANSYDLSPNGQVVPGRPTGTGLTWRLRHSRVLPAIVAAAAALLTGGGLAAASRANTGPDPAATPIDTVSGSGVATTGVVSIATTVPTTVPVSETVVTPVSVSIAPPPATPPPPAPAPTTESRSETPSGPSDNPDGAGQDDAGDEDTTSDSDDHGNDDAGDDVGGGDVDIELRTGPAEEPVLFFNTGYVGRWVGAEFNYSAAGDDGPGWLVGSTVQLRNPSGVTHQATVTECNGGLLLSPPPPPSEGADLYWYTDGAPFAAQAMTDDNGLEMMNSVLSEHGIDPSRVDSYGVPLAADGTADRLLWYTGDNEAIWWVATFDIEAAAFSTIDGDPFQDPVYEIQEPSGLWHDLDGDQNLESFWFAGETTRLVEWADPGSQWFAPMPICG